MAKLQFSPIWPGCAQGRYVVKAKGCLLAVLRWGNESGPLEGWGPFGYVPVDPAGNGAFFFSGTRGIPRAATRVWAQCVGHDFQALEDVSAEIPEKYLPAAADGEASRFSLLTDLHLSAKPWKIRQALRAAESGTICLLGDSTNDGLGQQFADFEGCIAEAAGDRVILPVIGNHDVTHPKNASWEDGCRDYEAFQARRLGEAEAKGFAFERDPDSLAWATRRGGLDIIGMQCVISGRKFLFPEGRQVEWLERRLKAQADADWHLILCHAPLLHHNPNREDGQPYLDRNRQLEALIEDTGRCIFMSGHTHVSCNVKKGAAEWDAARGNLYLNCGSVVDTATEGEQGLMDADWKDGCVTELAVYRDAVEITTKSVRTGMRFPRGYYRFERDRSARTAL